MPMSFEDFMAAFPTARKLRPAKHRRSQGRQHRSSSTLVMTKTPNALQSGAERGLRWHSNVRDLVASTRHRRGLR